MRLDEGVRAILTALLFVSTTGNLPAAESKAKIDQVIVVFKTHFDIGYTELAREVVSRYRTSMIDQALAVCDASRRLPPENRFVWTISGWPMQQILWPGQSPTRRARIEQAVREGLLVWHALPGSTHTESMDLEDLVRELGFSTRLSRGFGQALARDAKMTDVPSHAWALPTLLAHAGVEFLHIGCNAGSSSPEVPALFWWEGPDGSRLLTFYAAGGYGSGLLPPEDWPYRTWLALIHSGDNQGPPKPEAVEKLLAQAAKELPGVKIRMGRLSDFADALRKEKAAIPVVRGDMPDTWIFGIQSMPIETAIARVSRPMIFAAESLNTMLALRKVTAPPIEDNVAEAYEQSYLYSEHTWGASRKYFLPRTWGDEWKAARAAGKYAYADESWREHGAYARNVQTLIQPTLRRNLDSLAAAVKVDGQRVVVFNPLPWRRTDLVTLAVPSGPASDWIDASTGKPARCDTRDGKLLLLAEDMPALGYRTYVPGGSAQPKAAVPHAASTTLENQFFAIRLDAERGGVASLVDRRSGRELVDQKSKYVLGQYLYERFNDDIHKAYLESYRKIKQPWTEEFGKPGMSPASVTPHVAISPSKTQLRTWAGASFAEAQLVAAPSQQLPHAVTLHVRLAPDQPYVDLVWEIRDKPPEPWAEAGWMCLPLAMPEPTFQLGRVGAVIDPAKDIRVGSNHEMFCVASGLTVTSGKSGVGICPVESPLVSLGAPGVFRYTREFTPRQPVVFVHLFNNVWSTNFQQWIGGSWSCRVRLWSTGSGSLESDLITPGWEARTPCHAVWHEGRPGRLPPSESGIELSRKGVLLTALGPNPDGDGMVLRLWEQAGQDGPCEVHLPDWLRAKSVQPCDLRGTPRGDPLPRRPLTVALRRYAPASMILMPE